MDARIKYGILAIVALAALFVVGTMSVAADPSDTSSAPTEDWIFNESKTTTISSKIWTVEYNITVKNGSKLLFDDCIFTFNGTDPREPVWIFTDVNSTIEIKNSEFASDEGSNGFYIEAHDNITVTNSKFTGLTANPSNDGGITVYDAKAKLDFMEINDTWHAAALYFENCQVDISNSEIYDIEGPGITIWVGDNEFNKWYNTTISETEVHDIDGDGITLRAYTNYGNASLECYMVDVYNITDEEGIAIDVGDHSSNDNGNGSVFIDLDWVEIFNIGDQGIYLSSCYQKQGAPGQNVYNVSITNSSLYNVTNTGIYTQMYYTHTDFYVYIDHTLIEDIALDPVFDRLSGVFWWRYYGSGTTNFYASNTTFRRCNPAGFEDWANQGPGTQNINFYNCTFTQNKQDSILFRIDRYSSQASSVIENCTFYDNEGYGVRSDVVYQYNQGTSQPVHIYNSTFLRHGLPSLAVTTASYEYSKNTGFNISGCLIEDQTSYAIEINLGYPQARSMIHIVESRINNTGGVRGSHANGYTGTTGFDVILINSTIENSTQSAISISGNSYYPQNQQVLIINSSILHAGGDAISLHSVLTSTQTNQIAGTVLIQNSTIMDVSGIAVALTCEPTDAPGVRSLVITNSTIWGAQRGIFAYGYYGEIWYSTIKDTLKEDVFLIQNTFHMWYNDFSAINDRKFKAYDGGEILFYYDLQINVRWDTGAPALGAIVQIMDNTQTLISVQTVTSQDGSLPVMLMKPYFVRETGVFGSTPYVINVSFLQVSKTIGVKLDRNKEVTIIMEDHFEPEIYILFPKQGHIQQSTTLQVRGSAWDSQSGIDKVLLSLDGDDWEPVTGEKLSWNYTFEVTTDQIKRFSGVFNLRAKAIDFAANEKVVFVQIRIDPTPPELTVDFPPDDYITNNPDIWVRGVTEVGSTVEINSVEVDVVVSMFTHKVRLYEGPNTISVISIDPLGNIQIERLTVTLDTQVPYLILVNPEEEVAMTNESFIMVEAQLEEALKVYIGDEPIKYDSDNYKVGTGVLTYQFNLTSVGENPLVIQARDKADNLLVIHRTVIYDTEKPWIQVISPYDTRKTHEIEVPRQEVTIVGTVEPTAELTIEGEDVTIQNGYFERLILAQPGENTIKLVATSAAGNTYTEYLIIIVDTQEPELTIFEDPEMIMNEPRYMIAGKATDNRGIDEILVNGKNYTLIDDGTGQYRVDIMWDENGNFSIPVDLLEGKNEFIIEVRDKVGHSMTESRIVRLDTHAPTLVLYFDPVTLTADGTYDSHTVTINITGYTDPGSTLYIDDTDGRSVKIEPNDDGTFKRSLDLQPSGVDTWIYARSTDSAENERLIIQEITYVPFKKDKAAETDWGLWFLVISLFVLIVIGLVSFIYVRSRREEWLEMEAAEATPIAPIVTEIEEPETLPGPEDLEIEEEEEEAVPVAPARPRPRPPQARRKATPRPRPKPVEEPPEGDTKDLSEQAAEADVEADETDQEGI